MKHGLLLVVLIQKKLYSQNGRIKKALRKKLHGKIDLVLKKKIINQVFQQQLQL